jgi:hypothetical protein
MKQTEVFIRDSNSAQFPAGSRAWARADGGELVALADQEVEAVTRFQEVVRVRVAFGYEFTISSAEYDALVEG